MSETSTTASVDNAVDNPVLQSYVYVQNLDQAEFPVIVTLYNVEGTAAPISVTIYQNGAAPIGTPSDAYIDRRWARISIANPLDTQPPLLVDTLVLHPNEVEPQIPVSSQYIRVVIRNIIIPTEEKPKK